MKATSYFSKAIVTATIVELTVLINPVHASNVNDSIQATKRNIINMIEIGGGGDSEFGVILQYEWNKRVYKNLFLGGGMGYHAHNTYEKVITSRSSNNPPYEPMPYTEYRYESMGMLELYGDAKLFTRDRKFSTYLNLEAGALIGSSSYGVGFARMGPGIKYEFGKKNPVLLTMDLNAQQYADKELGFAFKMGFGF